MEPGVDLSSLTDSLTEYSPNIWDIVANNNLTETLVVQSQLWTLLLPSAVRLS